MTLGGDLTRSEAHSFFPRNQEGWYPDRERNSGRITQVRENRDQLTMDLGGTATWSPGSGLQVDQSVGLQLQTFRTDLTSATGAGLASNRVRAVDAAAQRWGGQSFSEERQAGWLTQTQLSMGGRLFLQGAVRADRHSAFGTEADLFLSPRVGASWVASDEPLLREWIPDRWFDDLRLRAAYGTTGRAPSSGARATFVPEPFSLTPSQVGIGVVPRSPGNPDLRPERGSELEMGLDAALLGDRLALEATYFRKRTEDLILHQALPPSLGFSENPLVNVGRVSNWGYELSAELRLRPAPAVGWDVGVGFNTLTNRVLDMGEVPPFGERVWVIAGAPVLGYHGHRIRELDAEAGHAVVSDEMEFIGNPPELPGREAVLTSTLSFGESLSLYLQADYRGDVHQFNGTDEWRERVQGVGERWVRRDELPLEERLRRFGPYRTDGGLEVPVDLVWTPYVEPADFLRFREASLTYRLPDGVTEGVLQGRRGWLTVTGRNLATWSHSDFHGFDPETSFSSEMDFLTMPPARRLLLRLRVEF